MESPSERESIENLLVDLKKGRKRVVPTEEPCFTTNILTNAL
jgi:hypothetical protein